MLQIHMVTGVWVKRFACPSPTMCIKDEFSAKYFSSWQNTALQSAGQSYFNVFDDVDKRVIIIIIVLFNLERSYSTFPPWENQTYTHNYFSNGLITTAGINIVTLNPSAVCSFQRRYYGLRHGVPSCVQRALRSERIRRVHPLIIDGLQWPAFVSHCRLSL